MTSMAWVGYRGENEEFEGRRCVDKTDSALHKNPPSTHQDKLNNTAALEIRHSTENNTGKLYGVDPGQLKFGLIRCDLSCVRLLPSGGPEMPAPATAVEFCFRSSYLLHQAVQVHRSARLEKARRK